MKKILFVAFALIVMGTSLYGQKRQVGDLVMDNEIPAVVVYVDSTGEHGLLLGLHKFPSNYTVDAAGTGGIIAIVAISQAKKYVRAQDHMNIRLIKETMSDELLDKYLSEEYPCDGFIKKDKSGNPKYKDNILEVYSIKGNDKNYDKKTAIKAYTAVSNCGLTKGQEISAFINEYCQSNEIDKAIYFRSQYWTDFLGNGWFIPGDAELEQMSIALCGYKLGEEFTMSKIPYSVKKSKPAMEEHSKLTIGYQINEKLKDTGIGYFFSSMLLSSNMTVVKNDADYHVFSVAGMKARGNKTYKAIISSGFTEIDNKTYGKYGKYKCSSLEPLGGFGSMGDCCYMCGFDIATLPVKVF